MTDPGVADADVTGPSPTAPIPTTAAPLRVDAHHHLWDLSVRDQEWTRDLPVLRRSFAFTDLVPELLRHRIDATVLVQTVTIAAETPEFLALAAEQDLIRGVVGWVDLCAPDVAERIDQLRGLPGGEFLVGIRHQVQQEADPAWLQRPEVERGLAAVRDAGLVYDVVVTHEQLPAVVTAVQTVPGVRWVLDHAGKPPIASGESELWGTNLRALAAYPNVACKLSGLLTEADADWRVEQLAPYAAQVLDAFGVDRVMFGSDWPVCLLRASYDGVVETTESFLEHLSPAERVDIWGGTAQRWYGL